MLTRWREYRAQYYGMITLIDEQIGRLMRRMAALGLDQNTLVVLTGDHGQSFAEHTAWFNGSSLYNAETRVPLIMALPGRVRPGTTVTMPAMGIDLTPTVLEAIGAPVPELIEGESLLPRLSGQGDGDDRLAISELADNSQLAIADREWKLIWSVNDQSVRLYYLPDDPNELNDRAEEQPDVAARLLTALQEWRAAHPSS